MSAARGSRPSHDEGGEPGRPVAIEVRGATASRIAELAALVRGLGARPVVGPDGEIGTAARSGARVALAVVELPRLPVSGSVELSAVRALHDRGVRVVTYADGVEGWRVRDRCLPLIAGAERVLDSGRPEFAGALRALLAKWIEDQAASQAEARRLRETMEQLGIVGCSPSMLGVFRLVIRFSVLSDLPTVIRGETGTGKERLAQALHRLDPRRAQQPFVALNCAALNPALTESELFGHRRGAFTGAERERKGLFRAAHHGVLFLDEIGDLSEAAQGKLLRVLQEGRVLAVGEEREEPVDVRVVAATHRDLESEVQAGRFRPDLYHRLNVLIVSVPPLRERREDVAPLVEFFLRKHGALTGQSGLRAETEFLEAVSQLELRGNVRQLENLVRRALVNHTEGAGLRLTDLPTEVWQEIAGQRPAAPNPDVTPAPLAEGRSARLEPGADIGWEEVRRQLPRLLESEGTLFRSLAWCERLLVSTAIERAQGNQTEAARRLGLTPRSVYNKLRKHHLTDAAGAGGSTGG